MLLIHLFVCFVRVSFSQFSLPLGVGGKLQFVIVALLSNYIYINWYSDVLIACYCFYTVSMA